MSLSRVLLGCIMVFSLSVVSEAQVPKIEFGASPTPSVKLSPFVPAQFPEFSSFFPPATAAVQQASFALENLSDRTIVGLCVRWVLTEKSGKKRPHDTCSDSFMSATLDPVALPRSKLLVAPGFLLPESLASGRRGFVGASPGNMRRDETAFSGASAITADVDSIIFNDGEVVGQDRLQFPAEIQARKAAAEALVKQVRAALARGEQPSSIFSQLAARPPLQSDPFAMWTSRFADQLKHARYFEDVLTYLENFPQPPNFFRRGGNQ